MATDPTMGGIDLSLLRGDNDMAAMCAFKQVTYMTKVQMESYDETGKRVVKEEEVQMPALEIAFAMANGKTMIKVCIPPDMVLPLVGNTTGWVLRLGQQMTQAATQAAAENGGLQVP